MSDYKTLLQDSMEILTDGTRLSMNHLFRNGASGKVQRMNYWNGRYRFGDQYAPHDVGLLLGRLWLLHLYNKSDDFKEWAFKVMDPIMEDMVEKPINSHGSGFELYYGLAFAAEILKSNEWRDRAMQATDHMIEALWSDKAKVFFVTRNFPQTNIDDIGLMLSIHWGIKHNSGYQKKLEAHYDTLVERKMIRPDGSTVQVIVFDDNHDFLHYSTWQGIDVYSTWARAQAWNLHNFTAAYEATGEQRFLNTAVKLADYWCANIPDDFVPRYDFNDPDWARKPKDSCAAAMSALAMARLNRYRPELGSRYRPVVEGTLTELCTKYLGEGGILMHGSWGDRRWRIAFGLPQFGSTRFPQEEIMPYGNYYFVEALYRELNDDWSLFKLGKR